MWNQLNVNTPHLLYVAIGGFLCLFMLFSTVIKDRFYFGEANVALLVGSILGPFVAKAVNPNVWSNFDFVVLEFSRVVVIIQCFVVALELPKYYIEKHWKSLLLLVGPVVLWGWMVCSMLVWFMVPHLSFTQSMTIASCFNAIDPVMAATIVGKGKFAKKVPHNIRNLLLAESASNDVTTSVCLGLSILLTRFSGTPSETAKSLFVYTIIYQIILAGVVGLFIGWAAQKALKYQWENESTDRESFLVFYLMVALFCVGLGSLLGIDDVLMAFCAGYNFDKTKWWRDKTEESHVSDAINLLLNLTYFLFLGSMIPWSSFNEPALQISAWRLVTGTLLIFLLRRLPIMLLLKPVIPDIRLWREALFIGHFGPVGAGAIFSAALISSEPGKTGITGNLLKSSPGDPMQMSLWPIVTFVVFCSSIVHGSSIQIFTIGKHINTLTLTISYTADNEDGPSWMKRLPKITTPSSSKGRKVSDIGEYPPGSLPAVGHPGLFLRRQRDDDEDSNQSYSSSSIPRGQSKRQRDSGVGPGGLASKSATHSTGTSHGQTLKPKSNRGPALAYQIGNTITVEDEDGNVIKTYEIPSSALTPTNRKDVGKATPNSSAKTINEESDDDSRIRFTIGGAGRRLTKEDFLQQIQLLDPKVRARAFDFQEKSSREVGKRTEAQMRGIQETSGHVPESNAPLSLTDYPETRVERRRRLAALGSSAHSDTSDDDSTTHQDGGPWASGGLGDLADTEIKEDTTIHAPGNEETVESIAKPRDLEQVQTKSSSEFDLKTSIPKVIITEAEDQDRGIWLHEIGESGSEMSEAGEKKKGKEKRRVSFDL